MHYADEAIWLRATQIDGQEIWGDVDEDEQETLAYALLKLGQRSPVAAVAIRTAIDWHDYAALLAIVVPRTKQTVKALREAPRKPRQPRGLFRKASA